MPDPTDPQQAVYQLDRVYWPRTGGWSGRLITYDDSLEYAPCCVCVTPDIPVGLFANVTIIGTFQLGEELSVHTSVTNQTGGALTNVRVLSTDPTLTGVPTTGVALADGASHREILTYTLVQADIDAGRWRVKVTWEATNSVPEQIEVEKAGTISAPAP